MSIPGVLWVDLCEKWPRQEPVIIAVVVSTIMETPKLIKSKWKESVFSNVKLDVLDRHVKRPKRYILFKLVIL